jgi:electron transfer flavoprotein alpha subunit
MANVLVVAELLEGKARKTTLCAVTAAKQIAEGTGGSFDILSIGEGAGAAADELAGYGAGKVLKAEIAGGYVCEKYAATAAEAGKTTMT